MSGGSNLLFAVTRGHISSASTSTRLIEIAIIYGQTIVNSHYRIVRTCAFHASNIGMSYYGLEHNTWCDREYELFFIRGLKQGVP